MPKQVARHTLTSEDVEERSNADLIAKIIVTGQVVWFAIAVISRLASHIPVTPLEAHTVVHVGCALVMYLMWWEKPYNVDRSILLTDSKTKSIASLLMFRDFLQAGFQQKLDDYERANERYWRNRVVHASEEILNGNLPPMAPVRLSIDRALENLYSGHLGAIERGERHSALQPVRHASIGDQRESCVGQSCTSTKIEGRLWTAS